MRIENMKLELKEKRRKFENQDRKYETRTEREEEKGEESKDKSSAEKSFLQNLGEQFTLITSCCPWN